MKIRKLPSFILLSVLATLLVSCVGIDARIKISAGGSGTVTAEYTLSEELAVFGETEANKGLLPFPLSRQDLQKSLAPASGLALQSWSESRRGGNILVKMEISFDSIDSLLKYLDPQGKMARLQAADGRSTMVLSLGGNMPPLDQDMKALAVEAFSPYSFRVAVEPPSKPVDARSGTPALRARVEGSAAVFEGSMSDVVTSEASPSMSLTW